ncbi:MAG TPA: AI-2E family transporter [Polyangia bacterium]|jgi:predicted PurR-regulated permease PerM|nr:AI-2E family transporter [Polyangia bacterium]
MSAEDPPSSRPGPSARGTPVVENVPPRDPARLTPAPVPRAAPARSSRTVAWLRRFAKLWGFALFCVFVVYLFRDVALPFLFAILVAYILAPVVDRLARMRVGTRTLPRAAAVLIVYVNILAALGLFIGYFIPKLSTDFARLFREAPQLFTRLNHELLPRAGAWVDRNLGAGDTVEAEPALRPSPSSRTGVIVEPLTGGRFKIGLDNLSLEVTPVADGKYLIAPPHSEDAENLTGGKWERSIKKWISERVASTEGESRRAIEYGQKFVTAVVSGIGRTFLVLMVAAFILIDLQRVKGFLRSLVPDSYQSDYDRIVVGIDHGLSGVIRGQLIICLINGSMTYIGILIFHVKFPLLLAGIAAVMSLVPIFGSILSSIPIVAIALISSGDFDISRGVSVLAWICGIHLIEANFLNPKIMGDAAKIHPVLVVFALIAGEHSYGLTGALFAVPVASMIQTIFVYYRRRGFERPRSPATATSPTP